MKRTPLNRGSKELNRTPLNSGSKKLQTRKRLQPRSKKTAKKYREERIPLVKRLLAERPWCEACKIFAEADGRTWYRANPSSDLHEVVSRGRSGGVNSEEWLDPNNILCVCRPHHTQITENPIEAEILGFLAPSECGNMNTHKMIRKAWEDGDADKAVAIWRTYPGRETWPLPEQIERLRSPQVDDSSENPS